MSVDIKKLEELTKAISPLPWRTNGWCIHDANGMIPVADVRSEKARDQENARYIVAACNSLPALIDELKEARAEKGYLKRHSEWLERKLQLRIDNNAALIQWVQELEKVLIELVKMEVPLPECAACWDRDECTDHAHGDDCLAIKHIIDVAKKSRQGGPKCQLTSKNWKLSLKPQRRGHGIGDTMCFRGYSITNLVCLLESMTSPLPH